MVKTLTIINDLNMRGVLAPAASLSREVLEDMIDLVELSSKKEMQKTASRLGSSRAHWTRLTKIVRKR